MNAWCLWGSFPFVASIFFLKLWLCSFQHLKKKRMVRPSSVEDYTRTLSHLHEQEEEKPSDLGIRASSQPDLIKYWNVNAHLSVHSLITSKAIHSPTLIFQMTKLKIKIYEITTRTIRTRSPTISSLGEKSSHLPSVLWGQCSSRNLPCELS